MSKCAFCDAECIPTREHVIPDWFHCSIDSEQYEIFNALRPTKHRKGALLVKDVCHNCNSGELSTLDNYGKSLFQQVMSRAVYFEEEVDLEFDRELLLRWLLKLCFNSGRMHGVDTTVLAEYRRFILGRDECPSEVELFVNLVSPADHSVSPPVAARRGKEGLESTQESRGFRITQFRMIDDSLSDVVQRQVYIDGYCFTLFVCDPRKTDQKTEMRRLSTAFQVAYPMAHRVDSDLAKGLRACTLHVAHTLECHFSNYPNRYGHNELTANSPYRDLIRAKVDREYGPILVRFTQEQVDTDNIHPVCDFLSNLVATREAAMSTMQQVTLFTSCYDGDPRELWEIPRVKCFVKRVFKAFPYLFFLADVEHKAIDLLLLCFCRVRIRKHGDQLSRVCNKADVEEFLSHGRSGLEKIAHRYAIGTERVEKLNAAILERAKRFLTPK